MEEWKVVREFPEHYEISNLGRLRRIKSVRGCRTGNIRVPRLHTGYIVYLISVDGKPYLRYAHRMVADAFIGPIPKGMQVNHIDGNRANPVAENLEIITCSENRAHSYRVLGNKPNKSVETNGNVKLTWGIVDKIRSEYANGGISHPQLARRYGVSRMTILRIINKRSWRDEDRPANHVKD